jgi:hypothetical protein
LSVPGPARHRGDARRSTCIAFCLNRDAIGECPIGELRRPNSATKHTRTSDLLW